MNSVLIRDFFLGVMISFTIAVLTVSSILGTVTNDGTMPMSLIWQVLLLSMICSVVNLVYRSEKLKFIWQSIIGYLLTTSTIMGCGLVFGWYSYDGNTFDRAGFLIVSFLVYSLCYLITWLIIWKVNKARKASWNDRLREYKEKNEGR